MDLITLNFVSGKNQSKLIGNVPIVDDLINEALEYFVVDLSWGEYKPSIDFQINRSRIRIDIVDNDGECTKKLHIYISIFNVYV